MATVVPAALHSHLTRDGKRCVACSMYAKGKAFLGAAILLRQKGGDEFVVLHLLCQGIEVTLKGILLWIDYDSFKPRLRNIGHNLVSASEAVTKAAGLSPLKPEVAEELQALSNLYSKHLLRYGSGYDILVIPSSIQSNRVLRSMAAGLRLAERIGITNDRTI